MLNEFVLLCKPCKDLQGEQKARIFAGDTRFEVRTDMDFKKLDKRFKQFGGFRLLREYARLGVLGVGMKSFFRCWAKGTSFKGIYPQILKKVEPFLERKYAPVVQAFKNRSGQTCLKHDRSRIIWFCWLQGLEQAPALVRVCHDSLKRHLPGWEIKVIDGGNWRDFVELPGYVVRKWEKGRIPAANFSDLLRLELLIRYGGTWVDATVLCTGEPASGIPLSTYLDADLFLFQYTPEGTTKGIRISNWYITSCTNHPVLMAVREMLYAYWKDYDCTIDYYMFHLFFEMVAREYPEQIAAMPYGSSQRSIALGRHWNEPFKQEQWDRLVRRVAFHKLSYRVSAVVKKNKENYYNYLISAL